MLAALLENNNNTQPQPSPQPSSRLPTVKIDRGGGGQSWPSYEIVDIVGAMAAFPEISGEPPLVRAARRHRWIGEALPVVRDAREKREALAFLAGATLADAAAEERHAVVDAQRAVMDELKIEQLVEIIDSVRGATPSPVAMTFHERGAAGPSNGFGAFVGGLVLGGLVVGIVLASRRDR
jgi:hypothetical protein